MTLENTCIMESNEAVATWKKAPEECHKLNMTIVPKELPLLEHYYRNAVKAPKTCTSNTFVWLTNVSDIQTEKGKADNPKSNLASTKISKSTFPVTTVQSENDDIPRKVVIYAGFTVCAISVVCVAVAAACLAKKAVRKRSGSRRYVKNEQTPRRANVKHSRPSRRPPAVPPPEEPQKELKKNTRSRLTRRPRSRDVWRILSEIGIVRRPSSCSGDIPLTVSTPQSERKDGRRPSSDSTVKDSDQVVDMSPKGTTNPPKDTDINCDSMRSNRCNSEGSALAKHKRRPSRDESPTLPARYYRPFPIPSSPQPGHRCRPATTEDVPGGSTRSNEKTDKIEWEPEMYATVDKNKPKKSRPEPQAYDVPPARRTSANLDTGSPEGDTGSNSESGTESPHSPTGSYDMIDNPIYNGLGKL